MHSKFRENSREHRAIIDLKRLHPEASFVRIMGVNYVHIRDEDEGDLYLTEHGIPFIRQLMPENWYEETWLTKNRQRLEGTGTVYRLPTKPIDARPKSIDLVIKWSRVGQDIPLSTQTLDTNINAEFNSPFEEFSLLNELRMQASRERRRVRTQKPLAIYVPPERMQLWQTGRSRDKILTRIARHAGVHIDILRSYILVYGWVKGANAVDAVGASSSSMADGRQKLTALTHHVSQQLHQHDFMVADHKPTHVIVRMRNGRVRQHRDGTPAYAIVDYELLCRTADQEDKIQAARRREYLSRQRDRFLPRAPEAYPEYLKPCTVNSVDYVYGRSESTNGALWVTGCDPELFSYFLPERWYTRQVRLSPTGQVYYTQTRDRIHVVWRVSRVGELAAGDITAPEVRRRIVHGFNTPFEEFALALDLARKGVPTVYPRAIYMSATAANLRGIIIDERRFEGAELELTPDGQPILQRDHDYVLIWGYWRGLEDQSATTDAHLWTPIDAAQALAINLIDRPAFDHALQRHQQLLEAAGYVDLNFKPDHVLLSYVPAGPIKQTSNGEIETRHCNFEMIAPLCL